MNAPAPYSGYRVTTDKPGHVDVAMPVGTRCPAIRGGVVRASGYIDRGFGYYAIIRETDGTQVIYAHGNLPALLVVGARVDAGDTVLYSGGVGPAAGHSTGPHLHLGAGRDGKPVDPFRRLSRSRYFWPGVAAAVGAAVAGLVWWRVKR